MAEFNRNNLDAVRLIAAFLVLYGHSFVFLGLREPLFLSWLPLGSLGVFIFFTISGYLISQSWQRDPHAIRFLQRRALRIFPGLAVCVLLLVFVLGPALTTWSIRDYFQSAYTWGYLRNIALYISYYLPGVFESARVPNAVNGSLWSLPVEFLMYLVVLIVGVIAGSRWVIAFLAISSAFISIGWAQVGEQVVIYGFDLRQVFICGTYFWIGAAIYLFDLKRYFSISIVMMALITLICFEPWAGILQVVAWGALPVAVLAFGLSYNRILGWLTRTGDYSYGIYIYAFPIQQTVIYLLPEIKIGSYLMLCSSVVLSCAILSWHLVEKRAMKLKPKTMGLSR